VRETTRADGTRSWQFLRGDTPMGGMRPLGRLAAGARPHWLVYVAVDDVDAAVARALSLGATASFPCADVPGVGRVGGLVDPAGAAIAVGRSASA
jgi:predicted enzyme related to lactoylglutathione lyase